MRMWKALGVALIVVLAVSSVAAAAPVNVIVNGILLQPHSPAITESGRTLVPFRDFFEVFGATVQWDGETETVTVQGEENTVSLQIGSTTATVNGEQVALDVPATVRNGTTLVPLRFLSEAFGADVGWDNHSQTATVDIDYLSQADTGVLTNLSNAEQQALYNYAANGNRFSKVAPRYEYSISGAPGNTRLALATPAYMALWAGHNRNDQETFAGFMSLVDGRIAVIATVYGDLDVGEGWNVSISQQGGHVAPVTSNEQSTGEQTSAWPYSPAYVATNIYYFDNDDLDLNSPITVVLQELGGVTYTREYDLSKLQ